MNNTKERPILFSTEMITAILEKLKTMTRRINYKCEVGDVLWVQETWRFLPHEVRDRDVVKNRIVFKEGGDKLFYFSDNERREKWRKYASKQGWQSPYYMPREGARIFLKVTAVRQERLQDISIDDARAEGVCILNWTKRGGYGGDDSPFYRVVFMILWDKLNASRGYSWESNPMVNVIEFEVLEGYDE